MRNKINQYRIFYVMALSFILTASCTDDFEEINTNPNEQVVGSNSGLMLGAQLSSSVLLVDNVRSFNGGLSQWAQYYSRSIDTNEFAPINPRSIFNEFWIYQRLVVQSLPGIERVLDNTANGSNPNYRAAALVMKAWIYENLTEFWGPVPFTDAQFGEKSEDPQFNRPKLDRQEDIFKGVLSILEEANATFDLSGNPSFTIQADSDAFAGGDISKWQKFGNSLRLRILMRISDADAPFAQEGIESIYANLEANPIMDSNDDNIGITYENATSGFPDPLERYVADNGFAPAASTGFVNILGDRLDPRMKQLIAPAASYEDEETYIGLPPAFEPENPSGFTRIARDSVSALSEKFTVAQFRPIMTFAEVSFIAAEAALKNYNIGSTSQEAYELGITAHMDEVGDITAAEISDYIAGPLVAYDGANALEQIITQRYIAQFGQSANTFAMIRRTGLPELDFFRIGVNADLGYPVRMQYPPTFENFNKENFDAALAGVTFLSPVFGDNLWFAQNAPEVKAKTELQTGPVTYSY